MNICIYNPYGMQVDLFHNFSAFRLILKRMRAIYYRVVTSFNDIDFDTTDALLIPSGDHLIASQHLNTIRHWVRRGGRLLLLSAMGGERALHTDTNLTDVTSIPSCPITHSKTTLSCSRCNRAVV